MSATVLYLSVPVDGFIAGPNEGPGNGLGDGGHRSTSGVMSAGGDVDIEALRRLGSVNGKVADEFMSTGAVVAGRGTFELAGGWDGDHHDGVPILVVARGEPGMGPPGPCDCQVRTVTAQTAPRQSDMARRR